MNIKQTESKAVGERTCFDVTRIEDYGING